MDTSILLARLIGPVFVIVGLGVFLNRRSYAGMTASVVKSPGLVYLSGLMALVTGIALVLFHNLWVSDWRVVLTILGWLSVLKGTALILFPSMGTLYVDRYARKRWIPVATALGAILIGAVLTAEGYAMGAKLLAPR